MSEGWPQTVRFHTIDFERNVTESGVYYQLPEGIRNRATEVYVSIHNPTEHFHKWDGELWCKAHSTRNKFISVKIYRGHVYMGDEYKFESNINLRNLTDPETEEEYLKQLQRAKGVGIGICSRLLILQSESLKMMVQNSF